MHCKSCDYPLWNLTGRTCPECGKQFLPSEFSFNVNAVRFCCPHCSQAYYGTGANGHLVPTEFSCVKCGQRVSMDEMVMLPAEGVTEAQTKADSVPWLERRRIGFTRAFFSTIGASMVRPTQIGRGLPQAPQGPFQARPESSVGAAWLFAFLCAASYAVITTLPFLCILGFAPGGGTAMDVLGIMATFIGIGTAGPLALILFGGLIVHAVLRMSGTTACSIGRTYEALCYSSAANALQMLPCMGFYFSWIWWVVSAIFVVKDGQRVAGGRASLAVLVYAGLVLAAIATLYFGLIIVATSSARFAATAASRAAASGATAGPFAQTLTTDLWMYGRRHGGEGPPHVLELLIDPGSLSNPDNSGALSGVFLASTSSTSESDIPIGRVTLDKFREMSASGKRNVVDQLAAAQPKGLIAYRFGDYVFTYPGADLRVRDPELWVLVMAPDPDVNGLTQQYESVEVGFADGTLVSMPLSDMRAILPAQNAHRATLNLPPLPDIAMIRHSSPAAAPQPDQRDDSADQPEQ